MKFAAEPAAAFRTACQRVADDGGELEQKAKRYLLSTVLAHTSGRGNSVPEALQCLRHSAAADGTRPAGTVYFLQNGDIRSTTRQWGFRRAVELLGEAQVEEGVLPQQKPDVAGLTVGSASFQWDKCGSTILPGAICEHLTSCGGMLHEGAGQTPLTEFLRYGAAGASGTVTEPYAIQAKFPTPLIHWYYAQGCTLAEAFYQSVTGPYQLLIVGDGLCQPWARRLEIEVGGLTAGAVLNGIAPLVPRAVDSEELEPIVYEFHLDGRRIAVAAASKAMDLDTRQFPDGWHELLVAGRAGDAVASGGTVCLPIVIRNGTAELTVSSPEPGDHPWDRPLEVRARSAGASEIVFWHHARAVARIQGSEGRTTIDPRLLGQGPSRIQPVAEFASGTEVWGRPLEVNIIPPAPLPALELPAGEQLAAGFEVVVDGKAPRIVDRAEGNWLSEAGVAETSPFALEAWFEAPADDVYQFQLRGDAGTLAVDGVLQEWPRGETWWFVPVSLARGWHRLTVKGTASGQPRLDIRFGGRGTQRLDGQRFQHTIPATPTIGVKSCLPCLVERLEQRNRAIVGGSLLGVAGASY